MAEEFPALRFTSRSNPLVIISRTSALNELNRAGYLRRAGLPKGHLGTQSRAFPAESAHGSGRVSGAEVAASIADRRSLSVVDHNQVNRHLSRLDTKSQFLLQCGADRGQRIGTGAFRDF